MITSVVVTDSLPSGLNYVSASTTVGAVTFTNPIVYWNMPNMAKLTSAVATITATANSNSYYTNIAGVNFAEAPISGGFHVATSTVVFISDNAQTVNITPAKDTLVVSWLANGLGLDLQSNTNLAFPTNWNSVSSAAKVIDGTNYLTNSTTLPFEFFRLKGP
jgi:hypothetical protein